MSEQPQILLVEDAQDLAKVVIDELEAAGYHVRHAPDGETALRVAAQAGLELIILDWMLPGIAGIEVLRRLREQQTTPVLMLTARDSEIDRVLGLELGADDYLTKPFSMRELVARVRAMLRRRALIQQTLQRDQQPHSATLQIGELQIDPQAHSALLGNAPIELTRTEFALLYLLANNPGRVFSRAYLLDTVWEENYIGGDRSVDNAILRLRRKLQHIGEQIETVWGVGYRWKREAQQ